MVSGLVFGLFPALSTRSDVLPSLKQGSLGSGVSAGRRRLQDGLVVAQVAVSVVLLVGASLLLASVWRLQQVDAGLSRRSRAGGDRLRQLLEVSGRAVAAPALRAAGRAPNQLPGVESAAMTNAVPLVLQNPNETPFDIEGRTLRSGPPAAWRRPRGQPALLRHTRHPGAVGARRSPTSITASRSGWSSINQAMVRHWDGGDPVGSRALGRQRRHVVDGGRRGRRRPPVRPRCEAASRRPSFRWRRCRPDSAGAAMVRGASDPTALAAIDRRCRARPRPRHAGRGRADARAGARRVAGHAAPHGAAAGSLRRAGDGGDAGRDHRRDRRQRLAAHAGVRRTDGAGRHPHLGADDGAEAGPRAGRVPASCSAWSPPRRSPARCRRTCSIRRPATRSCCWPWRRFFSSPASSPASARPGGPPASIPLVALRAE